MAIRVAAPGLQETQYVMPPSRDWGVERLFVAMATLLALQDINAILNRRHVPVMRAPANRYLLTWDWDVLTEHTQQWQHVTRQPWDVSITDAKRSVDAMNA